MVTNVGSSVRLARLRLTLTTYQRGPSSVKWDSQCLAHSFLRLKEAPYMCPEPGTGLGSGRCVTSQCPFPSDARLLSLSDVISNCCWCDPQHHPQSSPWRSGRGPSHRGSIPGLWLPPWRHLCTLMKNSQCGAEAGQTRKLQVSGALPQPCCTLCFYSSTCNNIKA